MVERELDRGCHSDRLASIHLRLVMYKGKQSSECYKKPIPKTTHTFGSLMNRLYITKFHVDLPNSFLLHFQSKC